MRRSYRSGCHCVIIAPATAKKGRTEIWQRDKSYFWYDEEDEFFERDLSSAYHMGRAGEKELRKMLEEMSYTVFLSDASRGPADLIAWRSRYAGISGSVSKLY